jgi:hypothetical protein
MATKLQAVNTMLTSIGQAPVVSLEESNPEIASALLILDNTRIEVLGEGWNFNSEKGLSLAADNNGHILVPESILNLSVNQEDTAYRFRAVQRDGKLYDLLSHSFDWGSGTSLSCDIVWDVDYEDLPVVFATYIAQRAARAFAGRTIGSQEMVAFNAQDEAMLRANCLAYDCTTGRHNVFGVEKGRQGGVNYRPFNVIAR